MMTQRARMAIATSLGASALIGGVGLTVSSAWLITMASQHPPILALSVSIVMVRFFGIFRSLARYGERIMSHESVFRNLTALRVDLYEKLAHRSSRLVRDSNSGSYVKAVVDDIERAQEYQLRVSLPGLAALISLLFGLLIAIWIHPALLLTLLPISIALLISIPSIVAKKCGAQSATIEELENRYARQLSDATFGAMEAEIYGYRDRVLSRIHACEQDIADAERSLLRTIRALQLVSILLMGTSVVGTAMLAFNLESNVNLPAVKISMAIFLPLVIFEGITNWYPNLFTSGKLLHAQRSIDAMSQEPIDLTASTVNHPQNFQLVLNNASASWGHSLMKPVSTTISTGELLVIRGKSGSGKSTLSLALLGLLEYEGSITIGGHELREIGDLHLCISASLQRGHIFNTSLLENLKIGNPGANSEEISRMIKLLELDAIALDEVIGEFGRPISGGEAKRIGVARALLSSAPIVILDEPTEHLDSDLAARLESRIASECSNRTLVVITHSGWGKSTRTVTIERE
jgi:ATP-binding cassette subfamily C protein CydC